MRHFLPLALCATVALGACSSTDGKRVEYGKVGSVKSLEVPPELTAVPGDSRFVVPDAPGASGAKPAESPQRGQAATGAPAAGSGTRIGAPLASERLRIERSGTQRWLYVAESPEALWSTVREFWVANGLPIEREQRELGVMETAWVEARHRLPLTGLRAALSRTLGQSYQAPQLDRYRTRFERSVDGKGTEIYISHRTMSEVYIREGMDATKWQAEAPSPEIEAEFLTRLMLRLGASPEAARSAIDAPSVIPRARLVRAGESETIEFREGVGRAWREVGLVLDRSGFLVESRDRQKGLFLVRATDPAAEAAARPGRGVFANQASSRSDDRTMKDEKSGLIRVELSAAGELSRVSVSAQAGAEGTPGVGARILEVLQAQLQ